MNQFTKEELFILLEETEGGIYHDLRKKIQRMIDDCHGFDTKKIAQSHLNEVSSLISHAMCLLDMKEE